MKKTIWLLLMLPLGVFGQETDTRLWTGIGVQKKITPNVVLHFNAQLRTTNNFSDVGSVLGEIGIGYKLNKHWAVSGYYRFSEIQKWDKETYSTIYKPFHRFYGNIEYDRKVSVLKLSYRLRYQNQFKDTEVGLESTKSYVRNKLELAYPNPSRFTPAISADVFYKVGEEVDQIRYKVGVNYAIDKRNSIELSGFKDYSLLPTNLNVYTIGLMYKLKL